MQTPSLTASSSPHIHAPGDISTIMRDVIIALIPAAVASVVFFGIRSVLIMAVCCATCALGEYAARRIMNRDNTVPDLSAILTGLLLAFNLPPDIPLWMAATGSLFAIIVAKQVFGGLGYNPFNPALIGRAFLLISFTQAMTTWSPADFSSCMVTDTITAATPQAMTTATPLGIFKAAIKNGDAMPFVMNAKTTFRFLLGDMNGCIGETSSIALLLGACYLLARKVISWHIPVSYLGTAAVYAAVLRIVSPEASMPVAFHLLTGGMILGACFMATDMVTSPTTSAGKLIFGAGCGILTMVIRTVPGGSYPEGTSFAILIMNAFVPLINRATRHKVFGAAQKKRA